MGVTPIKSLQLTIQRVTDHQNQQPLLPLWVLYFTGFADKLYDKVGNENPHIQWGETDTKN